MNPDRALAAERQLARIHRFFPICRLLGNRWAVSRPWEGLTIALGLHLTTLTAALVRKLFLLGGGQHVISPANPGTTDAGAVAVMRSAGIDDDPGGGLKNRHVKLLGHRPNIVVDVDYEALSTLIERVPERIEACGPASRSPAPASADCAPPTGVDNERVYLYDLIIAKLDVFPMRVEEEPRAGLLSTPGPGRALRPRREGGGMVLGRRRAGRPS